jgi:hypothetical protein
LPEKYPIFPEEITPLGPVFSVVKRGNQVLYLGPEGRPARGHDARDLEAFKAVVSELCVLGNFKQVDVVRVFGVSAASVGAAVKVYQTQGVAGFFRSSKRKAIGS